MNATTKPSKSTKKATNRKATPKASLKIATKAPVAKKAKAVATAPVKKAPVKNGDSLTQIDAAVKWLGHQKSPKTVGEIVAGCADKGYWKSPDGKSPQRTLYTNLLREMAKDTCRVSKVGRGLFELMA